MSLNWTLTMVGSLCIMEAKAKLPGHCSCTYLNPASHPHTEGLQGDDVTADILSLPHTWQGLGLKKAKCQAQAATPKFWLFFQLLCGAEQ